MPNIPQELQTDTLGASNELQWKELMPDNWVLSMGLFGTVLVFNDGWWQYIGYRDKYANRKAESVEAAKQEAVLLVRLELDKLIAKLETL